MSFIAIFSRRFYKNLSEIYIQYIALQYGVLVHVVTCFRFINILQYVNCLVREKILTYCSQHDEWIGSHSV